MKVNDEIFKRLANDDIFPLQTIQSLAIRWGVSNQVVTNWLNRHSDFPKPLEGIIEQTPGAPKVFALSDVGIYEKVRGIRNEKSCK